MELEVETNRVERYENAPGGQSYGVKTFYRDGPRCKRGEDDQSRTPSPADGRYVWWATYGAGPRFGQILSSGKRAVWVTELSSMPRKTKHGAGPSHFSR